MKDLKVLGMMVLTFGMMLPAFSAQMNMPSPGSQSGDLYVVQYIISKCGGFDAKVANIVKTENGRVVFLDLSNKDYTHDGIQSLPREIGNLPELKTLLLKNNSLRTLPPEMVALQKLRKLDLGDNKFEEVPKVVFMLENLVTLDLRFNNIYTIPKEISDLNHLRYLQLWGNKLTQLPSSIVNCPSLAELYLNFNKLSTLPEGITTMKTLTYVDFQENRFCNVSPKIDRWLKSIDTEYRTAQICSMRY